ncbi:MAG: PulJ/GspJ family protein [Longimicrobiales bacterium]
MKQSVRNRGGFTMIELLLSMTVGLVIIGATMAFAQTTWRDIESSSVREDTYRDARFIAMALERDFAYTGVSLASTVEFGSLMVAGDTVMILSVPYTPAQSFAHSLDVSAVGPNPMGATGTCATNCVDLVAEADSTHDFAVGDLARIQVNDERRLLLVTGITNSDDVFDLEWYNVAQIMHLPAGLSTGPSLDRFSTFVQKLQTVIYYVDGTDLYRAQSLTATGEPDGVLLASGIHDWQVKLIFKDGDEADNANPTDGDATNDYDDLLGVRITAKIGADNIDMRIDDGNRFTRDFEWRFTPRNLVYERNR